MNDVKTEGRLRLLPYYTGDLTLEAAVENPKSVRLLWLEILLNRDCPWEAHWDQPVVRAAHDKACAWHGHFKTMIEWHIGPVPLVTRKAPIDMREQRRFLEALQFVAG